MPDQSLLIRHAAKSDINEICVLMKLYAAAQIVLPRDHKDVEEHLVNFRVAEYDGVFAGCVAVRDFGNSLYEIRSLAIKPELTGKRIGSCLIQEVVKEFSETKTPCRLFALTYRANFFINQGFKLVDKEMFPEKIWSDCQKCPKRDNCDEDAVLIVL
jgi:amino-acid N-acetyltransferase